MGPPPDRKPDAGNRRTLDRREDPMRLIEGRAAVWRGFACMLAIALCLASIIAGARAQEMLAGGPAAIASAGEPVLLREQPGYDAAVLVTLGDGNPLDVAGGPVTAADGTSWVPVIAGGQSGYVPAGYVTGAPVALVPAVVAEADPVSALGPVASSMSSTSESAPAPALMGRAATFTNTNLRSSPSPDAGILAVLPPGTTLSVDGAQSNGFVPVTGNGVSGWIAVELLAEGTATTVPLPAAVPETTTAPATVDATTQNPTAPTVAEPVAATAPESSVPVPDTVSGESTGIVWPISGGEWKVVQGYNTGTHTNRSGFAQYKYSLDWARVDGDTAGQPVFAPVSGTVQWVDRGSGGMLVDAGNGYGVAVFHVTIDRDLARGATVERGQRIGTISGPGGDGFMSMAHIDITVWQLNGGGHEAVPFVGPNAIAGQEFPDTGGANQHMGATVTP
jgi:murein DD-endopeptidase MepM/ murein hydrolase activator NlpD